MQLQELKDQIIENLGELYDEHYEQFVVDINECEDGWELLNTLEQYGYDTQGGLHILFSILIS